MGDIARMLPPLVPAKGQMLRSRPGSQSRTDGLLRQYAAQCVGQGDPASGAGNADYVSPASLWFGQLSLRIGWLQGGHSRRYDLPENYENKQTHDCNHKKIGPMGFG